MEDGNLPRSGIWGHRGVAARLTSYMSTINIIHKYTITNYTIVVKQSFRQLCDEECYWRIVMIVLLVP